jgi:hypothetical protein
MLVPRLRLSAVDTLTPLFVLLFMSNSSPLSSIMAQPNPSPIVTEGQGGGSVLYSVSGEAPGSESSVSSQPPNAPPSSSPPPATSPSPSAPPTPSSSPASPSAPVSASSASSAPFVLCVHTYGPSGAVVPNPACQATPAATPTTAPPAAPGAPAATPAAAPAPPPPSAIAASWWQVNGEDLLPRPAPYIAPGYALAGNPGYLQTNAPITQTFTASTPAGTLTITARGTFLVNWGDGTGWTGPYSTPGAPWPEGQITHVWEDVGTYDVVAVEYWTATWSLAGQGGTLTSLETYGSIPAFQVRQLEAVRNR